MPVRVVRTLPNGTVVYRGPRVGATGAIREGYFVMRNGARPSNILARQAANSDGGNGG